MGRKRVWPPRIGHNKGRDRVWWNDRWHDLGPSGSAEAKAEYGRLVATWAIDPASTPRRADDLLVVDLCHAYIASTACPTETRQRALVVLAVELLVKHHLSTAVSEFGPPDLAAWQDWLATIPHATRDTRFNSTTVRYLVSAIKRIWKWGVATGRVDSGLWQALTAVAPLKPGRARPPRDVPPADPIDVRKTVPFLRPQVRAMVLLEWLTGARPAEICGLKAGDIVRSGKVRIPGTEVLDLDATGVWVAVLTKHKTAWKGKPRWLTFGVDAQELLRPLLEGRSAEAYVFSPAEALADLRAEAKAERERRGGGSGGNRKRPVAVPRREPGDHYTPAAYYRAITRAAARAGVAHWFPYQLRHLAAVEVKAAFGLDGVQALLGHHTRSMAEHYGGTSFKMAAAAAKREIG